MGSAYEASRAFLRSNWEKLESVEVDQAKGLPMPPQEDPAPAEAVVTPLTPLAKLGIGGLGVLDALRARKSRRKYAPGPLSFDELSFLLWAAEGVRDSTAKRTFRAAPSGGARHPLDLYLFVARVEGLDTGLYRYLPLEHALLRMRAGDDSPLLDKAMRGQYWNAAAVFMWAAVPYRTEWRYGPAADKLVALDAGHSCENLYLACESIGCGTCAIGAYDQEQLDAYLDLDGVERFAIYIAPVGRTPAERG